MLTCLYLVDLPCLIWLLGLPPSFLNTTEVLLAFSNTLSEKHKLIHREPFLDTNNAPRKGSSNKL